MADAEPVSKPMHVVAIKQEASAISSVRHPYVRLKLPLLLAALLQYCLLHGVDAKALIVKTCSESISLHMQYQLERRLSASAQTGLGVTESSWTIENSC